MSLPASSLLGFYHNSRWLLCVMNLPQLRGGGMHPWLPRIECRWESRWKRPTHSHVRGEAEGRGKRVSVWVSTCYFLSTPQCFFVSSHSSFEVPYLSSWNPHVSSGNPLSSVDGSLLIELQLLQGLLLVTLYLWLLFPEQGMQGLDSLYRLLIGPTLVDGMLTFKYL